MYYVLKEFYSGEHRKSFYKHQVINMEAHRAKEFIAGGLLREIHHIAPESTKIVAPTKHKKKNANR